MTTLRPVPPPRPVVTVCGLPPGDPPPALLRALAALGAAAAEAYGQTVTVTARAAPTPPEEQQ